MSAPFFSPGISIVRIFLTINTEGGIIKVVISYH